VRPTDGVIEPATRPVCLLCGRPTYDPGAKGTPWARAVAGGRQVLICPDCRRDRSDWASGLDRCRSCGGTRLAVILGEVVCRDCGRTAGA
jgi:hypothetical protein